jgi:hypothetical protein
MRIECSYCGNDMGDQAPPGDLRVSHSVCQCCWDTLVLPETLNLRMPWPQVQGSVLVVNQDLRIVGANREAQQLVGRVPRDLGLLPGDYLGCRNALEPGGCGKTDPCGICSVRTAVQAAIGGVTCSHLPVSLRQDDHYLKLTISTETGNGLVRVTIHNALVEEAGAEIA